MNTSNKTTCNGTMKPKMMETTVTPKQLSIALRDDVIHRFLVEVKDEIDLVEQSNAGLELLKIGSRKKVAVIYIRILKRYQLAFPWLKPHLISCYKKKTDTKVSAKKEKELAFARAALTKNDDSAELSSDDFTSTAPLMHTMVQMQIH
jgi:hypothetical protein